MDIFLSLGSSRSYGLLDPSAHFVLRALQDEALHDLSVAQSPLVPCLEVFWRCASMSLQSGSRSLRRASKSFGTVPRGPSEISSLTNARIHLPLHINDLS